MLPYGFGPPEFKEESYRLVRGRGWVCFDAGFAIATGRKLLAQAETVPPHGWAGSDLAYAINMESGRTIPPEIARRALVKIARRSQSARAYLRGSTDGKDILEQAGVATD